MKMHLTRRTLLGSLTAAACLAAVNTKIRAGCLVQAKDFDGLLASLKQMQALGYSGFCTTARLMQTQAERLEEVRAQLSEFGMDLIGMRVTLPNYVELGEEAALDAIGRLGMAARQFGSRTLMVHSSGLAADGKFQPQDLDAKAKFFDKSAKKCKEMGVIFTYRTQEAEFQNGAAEVTGLMARTDKNIVYYDLNLAHPEAVGVFRDNPSRVFCMEGAFGDEALKIRDLAGAVKQSRWISWLIEAAPAEAPRTAMKKAFGV